MASSPPHSAPKAADSDGIFHGHKSSEIFLALQSHSKHMHNIEQQLHSLDPKHPQGAADIADAIVKYALQHKQQGDWPASVISPHPIKDHALLAANTLDNAKVNAVSSASALALPYPAAFSLAALLSRSTWAATIYAIVFLSIGLLLLFFGYASFYWARKVRFSDDHHPASAKRAGGNTYSSLGGGGANGRDSTAHLPVLGDGTSLAERLLGPSPSPRTRAAAAKKGGARNTTAASYQDPSNPSTHKPKLVFPTGIGGMLTTALFCTNLVMFITAAVIARRDVPLANLPPPTLAAGAFFAAMFLPFLAGLLFLCRLTFLPRPLAGLAGACAMTRLLSALFGIHTLLIRVVILAVFALLLAAPLIPLPGRAAYVQRLLCTLTTAIWGGISLLDGVVLLILSQARLHTGLPISTAEAGDLMPTAVGVQAASSWLDTWVVILAPDGSDSLLSASEHWGSSAFKGCIAASILLPIFGLIFQAILQHRAAAGKLGLFGIWGGGGAGATYGKDADEEWNDILGSYTQRYEKGVKELEGTMPANYNNLGGNVDPITGRPIYRAGLFEPAPSAWSKIAGVFGGGGAGSKGAPARYGNLGSDQAPSGHAPSSVPGGSGFRTLEAVAAASDLDLSLVASSKILGGGGSGFIDTGRRQKRKKGKKAGASGRGGKDAPARFQSMVAKDLDGDDGFVGRRKRSDSATLLSDDDEDEKNSPPYESESDSDEYDEEEEQGKVAQTSTEKRAFPTPVSFRLPSSTAKGTSGLPPPSSSTPPPVITPGILSLSPTSKDTSPLRPPSYRTNTDLSSASAGGNGTGSGLSGTTAGSSGVGKRSVSGPTTLLAAPPARTPSSSSNRSSSSSSSSSGGAVPMLITSTRGATARSMSLNSPISPAGATAGLGRLPPPMPAPPAGTNSNSTGGSGGGNGYVPATPSLVNAISRIQKAQEQARAWHAAQQGPAAVAAAKKDGAGAGKR
ncbi:hypothetical protein CF319_g2937 [Tilletia indica]|nr:hypothetical protein CF319_g2937 [Tilletia indica]